MGSLPTYHHIHYQYILRAQMVCNTKILGHIIFIWPVKLMSLLACHIPRLMSCLYMSLLACHIPRLMSGLYMSLLACHIPRLMSDLCPCWLVTYPGLCQTYVPVGVSHTQAYVRPMSLLACHIPRLMSDLCPCWRVTYPGLCQAYVPVGLSHTQLFSRCVHSDVLFQDSMSHAAINIRFHR